MFGILGVWTARSIERITNGVSGGGRSLRRGVSTGALLVVSCLLSLFGAVAAQSVVDLPVPTASSGPNTITVGPDNNLWFTEYNGNRIARFNPADPNAITGFPPLPTANSQPVEITVGPDSNLRLTEANANQIGRMTLGGGARVNILMIVIDTLRVDRLDFYGTRRELTPFLASLAEHGNVFWNAYAQSSWTMPSVASLWTSRYQSQHGVTVLSSVLAETECTLAEVLKGRGYTTGAFSASPLLAARGFRQGFDQYAVFQDDPVKAKEPAERLNQASLAWLDTLTANGHPSSPVFLYLQFMEPHFPYSPPADLLERILSRRKDPEQERRAYSEMSSVHSERWQHPDPVAADLIRDLYDAEVMSLDAQLTRLFSELGKRNFLRNAIVIITADHGEELMDHGGIGHGKTLYNEVIRLPLLILAPGQAERVDISGVVSEVDIAPTVLDLASIPAPASFEGHSLRAAMYRTRKPGRVLDFADGAFPRSNDGAPTAYSELLILGDERDLAPPRHVRSVVTGSYKLTVDSFGRYETYDLGSDPYETNPQALAASDRVALERALEVSTQRASRYASRPHTEPPDERTRERMRALGYIN